MKKKILIIFLPIITLIIYFIVDYKNLVEFMGLNSSSIDINVFAVLVESIIVIELYLISFYYIENRQKEKDLNAMDTVSVLLKNTYKECIDYLKLLDDREFVGVNIIPKVDGDKAASDNIVINNLQTLPFSSFDTVIDLAMSGYIAKNMIEEYLEVKKEYQYLVGMKITFYDLVMPKTPEQQAMYINIHKKDVDLKIKLKKLIEMLNC